MSSNALLEHRTDRLEESLIRLSEEMINLKNEMSDFKNEMSDFKNEMSDFKNEMSDFKNEMSDFKNEMSDFKNEMSDFKNEMRADFEKYSEENRKEHREMNKRWGELANKMGTIVEDIVYPAARPLIAKYFSYDVNDISIAENIIRRDSNTLAEFDIVASAKDKVFLIEVKSTVRESYIEALSKRKEQFFRLFPEYAGRKLIIIMASLKINDGMTDMLSRNNIYAMAYREWDYMDILNFDKVLID